MDRDNVAAKLLNLLDTRDTSMRLHDYDEYRSRTMDAAREFVDAMLAKELRDESNAEIDAREAEDIAEDRHLRSLDGD